MLLFSQISDRLKYPKNIKAKLSTLHSVVITYVTYNFVNTKKFKQQVVDVLNSLSYYVCQGDDITNFWDPKNPMTVQNVDSDDCKKAIGMLYLTPDMIEWDLEETPQESNVIKTRAISTDTNPIVKSDNLPPTNKEDLYIRNPIIPRLDSSKIFARGILDSEEYVIYESLPEIPTKQCEISATTDVNKMSNEQLLKLFPTQFIATRAACMYDSFIVKTEIKDKKIGYIIPIEGYSPNNLLDNIIQYPHFYKLMRIVNDNIVNMYDSIEIDGTLYNILEIWDDLAISKIVPKTSEFIKEYVVRRYLLERDIKGIKHKYPLFGELRPFLTLFMPPEDYASYGYNNPVELARACVESRIKYKQSRNPILRRLSN